MLKHSPAPWIIEPGNDPDEHDIWDAKLQRVATVYGPLEAANAGPEQDQLNADARLIAAAPPNVCVSTARCDMQIERRTLEFGHGNRVSSE